MTRHRQDEILRRFRQELVAEDLLHEGDSIGTDDETLLARKFNLAHSKKMFADCQRWRKTVEGVGIDKLYADMDPFDVGELLLFAIALLMFPEYPEREAVFECWPMWFHKTDKVIILAKDKRRPINVQIFGKMDLAKLYKVCTPERHRKSILVNAECLPREVLPAAARAAGRNIGNTLVIVDLKGFGLSQFWQVKGLARDSFQISQDYYPETMGQVVIINAPSSFTTIWNVIKLWLSKETVAKINILGNDYEPALLELVDAESLPTLFGGQCTCKDLGGCELSGAGPWLDGRKGWGPWSRAVQETKETT